MGLTIDRTGNPLRAAVWMIGAIVSFTSMAIAGRAVSFELDTFEIMMYRSFIGIALVISAGAAFNRLGDVTARRMDIHLIRNLSHFCGQNLWFFAITVIPLAQVFALEFSQPIWAMLLAMVVLGERLTSVRVATAAVGFLGILIVARPWVDGVSPGLLMAALAAVGFAGSAVFTRLLTRTETVFCILFWLTVIQAIFGVLCAGIDGDIALPSAESWPWLVLIGCAGLAAHFCLTTALSLAPASVVMPIDFARLPVIAVVGALIYAEPLQTAVFLGAALIFVANYLNILVETRANR